jgi:hypothetical protein
MIGSQRGSVQHSCARQRKFGQRGGAIPAPNPSDVSLGFARAPCFPSFFLLPFRVRAGTWCVDDIGTRGEMSACDMIFTVHRHARE